MTVFRQIWESLHFVKRADNATAKDTTLRTLEQLSLAHAKDYYPHELSGGIAQRASFASATVSGAYMVIADEPTKGLDHTNKIAVVDMLAQVAKQGGCLLTITHDTEVANRLSGDNDLLMVMKKGKLLEQGQATDVLQNPKSDYAKELMSANPATWTKADIAPTDTPLLTLKDMLSAVATKSYLVG